MWRVPVHLWYLRRHGTIIDLVDWFLGMEQQFGLVLYCLASQVEGEIIGICVLRYVFGSGTGLKRNEQVEYVRT
jgi:hypothetical protein